MIGFAQLGEAQPFVGDSDQRYQLFHLAYISDEMDEPRTGEVICLRTQFISDQVISLEFVGDAPGLVGDLDDSDLAETAKLYGVSTHDMLAYELPPIPWPLKEAWPDRRVAQTPPIREAFKVFLAHPREAGTSNASEVY